MKFIDIVRMCLRNLTKRKIRTLLTVSGVLIGTCAIIVMISLGIGMQNAMDQVLSQWADLTMIEVYRYGDKNEKGEDIPKITDDILTEWMNMKHVKGVTPIYEPGWNSVMIYAEDIAFQVNLVGVYMDQLENFGYKIKEGDFKKPTDPESTVVIGQNALNYGYNFETQEWEYSEWDNVEQVEKPFRINPLKAEVHIVPALMAEITNTWGNYWDIDYSTIGSQTAPNMEYDEILKVAGRIEGSWRDHYTMQGIFIDIGYARKLNKIYNELNPDFMQGNTTTDDSYSQVKIRIDDMNNVVGVEDQLKDMGYNTYSASQAREEMKKQTQLIQMVLGALAAVSLFVAALNITNTMVMSIIERTREIGIMKVLGCDVSNIRVLFLSEAGAIGLIGGIAGIGLSFIVSFVINKFLASNIISMLGSVDTSVITTDISVIQPWLLLLALGFATIVGLVSGFYPANKSVKISALEAIRRE